MAIDPDRKAQIKARIEAQIKTQSKVQSGIQVGALLFDEALTEVPAEYFDYNNIFLAENAAELLKNTKINEHVIELWTYLQPRPSRVGNLENLHRDQPGQRLYPTFQVSHRSTYPF